MSGQPVDPFSMTEAELLAELPIARAMTRPLRPHAAGASPAPAGVRGPAVHEGAEDSSLSAPSPDAPDQGRASGEVESVGTHAAPSPATTVAIDEQDAMAVVGWLFDLVARESEFAERHHANAVRARAERIREIAHRIAAAIEAGAR